MNTGVHFSSATPEWYTPRDLLTKLPPFVLDVCAMPGSEVCPHYYSPEQDGLVQDWVKDSAGGRFWMNPPYGRGMGLWLAKAHDAARRGAIGYLLLPARTDTKWFHEHVLPFFDGREHGNAMFIRGRLKFWSPSDHRGWSAPFPSVLVAMGEK